ncbi:M61 family metallopeptidase [Sphingopyxis sp. PAMC25046]|uniref:M61 family metallopeptidase n=1 Tax=Sphingopyxis sp. PAMC25046 TaxID=2565556 RepID=UPI0014462243|nr:M61 family metallopeptidase [Sphingopyxis sp. PAMC25046]
MSIDVDARDVLRGIQHTHIVMPTRPGPMTLAYPRWIPGEHRPNGPITQLIGLRIMANGEPLAWRRDTADAFSFRIDVPRGVNRIDVRLDYLSPARRFGAGFGKSPNVTPGLAYILFNHLLLYPADARADAVRVAASIRIPVGWRADGALPMTTASDGRLALPETTLARLVDSPVLASARLDRTALPGRSFPARVSIATDAAGEHSLAQRDAGALGRLVDETQRLIGGDPLDDYVWLVGVSERLHHDGIEHLASSDVRVAPGFFSDPSKRYQWSVLPHELFHVWNGKFRRPQEMATRNFQQPVTTDLLWVYEGLTRYYGDVVLPVRSGLVSREQTLDYLAFVGAQLDRGRPGRAWRSLADTAVTVPAFDDAPFDGTAARRAADYYNEMLLVWLEADMLIRQRSGGRRSLDDFCRLFLARTADGAEVAPYSRADVIRALRSVEDFDWDSFFKARIDEAAPQAPLEGLTAAGWKLVYGAEPNPFLADVEEGSGIHNLSTSLGLWVSEDGEVRDVAPGSPAFAAAIAPGTQIRKVDSRPWSINDLRASIAKAGAGPLRLDVRTGTLDRQLDIAYDGGPQIPSLHRIPGTQDMLRSIFTPLAQPEGDNHKEAS